MTDPTMKTTGNDEPDTPDLAEENGDETGQETSTDADAMKQKLRLRAIFAVALILALLGGLALVDEMNAPAPKPVDTLARAEKPVVPTSPAPPPPQVPALTPGAEPPAASADAAQETTASPSFPETASTDTVVTPPEGSPPLRPLTPPATARLAALPPSESTRALRPAPTARGEPATELARQAQPAPLAPQETAALPAQPSRPLSRAAAHTVPAGSGYLLQMGVFSSTANAEELRAKLELNGIPAQVESRVQIGPFASRAEAEQMRERLKKLGISEGVLVAARK